MNFEQLNAGMEARRGPIVNLNTHHWSRVVTLSEAKGLSRWVPRCFASLILRFAQDDSTELEWENLSSAVRAINDSVGKFKKWEMSFAKSP